MAARAYSENWASVLASICVCVYVLVLVSMCVCMCVCVLAHHRQYAVCMLVRVQVLVRANLSWPLVLPLVQADTAWWKPVELTANTGLPVNALLSVEPVCPRLHRRLRSLAAAPPAVGRETALPIPPFESVPRAPVANALSACSSEQHRQSAHMHLVLLHQMGAFRPTHCDAARTHRIIRVLPKQNFCLFHLCCLALRRSFGFFRLSAYTHILENEGSNMYICFHCKIPPPTTPTIVS